MAFELDHVFVFTALGAPEAERLVSFGLSEGSRNVHVGQGTANRRFFFQKGMLELIWMEDERAIRSDSIARTALAERALFRHTGASPFGICLRPDGSGQRVAPAPFETWSYRPRYLPDGLEIPVADSLLCEPMLFTTPVGQSASAPRAPVVEPTAHAAGVRTITKVRVTLASQAVLSPSLAAVEELGIATFVDGHEPLMELFFDGAMIGRSLDLRPELPLVLRV